MGLTAFASVLASTVEAGLRSGLSFPELCKDGQGATPMAVKAALVELAEGGSLRGRASELLRSASDAHDVRPELDPRLPVPHPLDFDWRFSASTAESLALGALVAAGRAPILLVGVPSVLLAICDRPNRPPVWFASRPDDPITRALRKAATPDIEFIDIQSDLAAIEAAVSIVDPPWYDDIARRMVTKAASGTSTDGEVWVAGPDALTGLSAAPGLANLPRNPSFFGLSAAEVSGILRYDTPPFEMLALRRNGICNVPPTWRTGRLHRCKRQEIIASAEVAPTGIWEEKGTDRARIWCRSGTPSGQFELIDSLGLSRLDPERAQAVIWTSSHRYSMARMDCNGGAGQDAFDRFCAAEAAILDELVCWRGGYDVQKG